MIHKLLVILLLTLFFALARSPANAFKADVDIASHALRAVLCDVGLFAKLVCGKQTGSPEENVLKLFRYVRFVVPIDCEFSS